MKPAGVQDARIDLKLFTGFNFMSKRKAAVEDEAAQICCNRYSSFRIIGEEHSVLVWRVGMSLHKNLFIRMFFISSGASQFSSDLHIRHVLRLSQSPQSCAGINFLSNSFAF